MPGIAISSLKVPQLKAELEKRGIERNGVKSTLVEKLRKVLIAEGLDPEDYYPAGDHMNENDDNSVSADGDGDSQQTTKSHADEEDLLKASTATEERDKDKLVSVSSNVEQSNIAVPSNTIVTASGDQNATTSNPAVGEDTTQAGGNGKDSSVDQDERAGSPQHEESDDNNLKRKKPIIKKSGKASENIIWVGNIGPNPSASDLKELFSQCGKVNVARIVTVTMRKTDNALAASNPLCYGYLEMMSAKDVELCIQEMDGIDYKDQTLAVATSLAGVKSKMLEIEEAAKQKKARLLAKQSEVNKNNTLVASKGKPEEKPGKTKTTGRLSEKPAVSRHSPNKDELAKRELKIITEERKLKQMRRQLELERKRFREEKTAQKPKERQPSASVNQLTKKTRIKRRNKALPSRLASAAAARLRAAKRQVTAATRKKEAASRRDRDIERNARVQRRRSPPRRSSKVLTVRRSRSPISKLRVNAQRGTAKRVASRISRVSPRGSRRDSTSHHDRKDSMGPPASKYSRRSDTALGSGRRVSSKNSSRLLDRPPSPRRSAHDRSSMSDRHPRDVYVSPSRPYGLQIAERLTDALLAVSAARRERMSLGLIDRSREILGASHALNMVSSSRRHSNPVSVNPSESYRHDDYRRYLDSYSTSRLSSHQERDERIPHLSYRR